MISQAVAPRNIRFVRTAGLSANQQLSPAEVSLLVSGHHLVAKYTVEQKVEKDCQQVMQYLDSQAPLPLRRMMQGQRIVWDVNPQTLAPIPTVNIPFLQNTLGFDENTGSGGVYKDRQRWIAVLYVPHSCHHLLGTYYCVFHYVLSPFQCFCYYSFLIFVFSCSSLVSFKEE
jgi:hypothetical protein